MIRPARWVVAASVAVACGLAVVLVVVPVLQAPRDPVRGPDDAAEPAPAPRDAVAAPWRTIAWAEVDDPFPRDLAFERGLGIGGDGHLAVAWGVASPRGRSGATNDAAAVAVSEDGRSWRVALVQDGVRPGESADIFGVALRAGTMLAYGHVNCCRHPVPAAWTSQDGTRWTRVPFEIDAPGVQTVVGGAGGWVALAHGRDRLSVWRSDDGSRWTEAAGVDAPDAFVADVAATPLGFVAVGHVQRPDGRADGAVWTSRDGAAWERVGARDPAFIDAAWTSLHRVVPFGDALFITGERLSLPQEECWVDHECARGALSGYWLSADGARFEYVDHRVEAAQAPPDLTAVMAGGPGLVAYTGGFQRDGTLWTSGDGRTWDRAITRRDLPSRVNLEAMTTVGRTLILMADVHSAVQRRQIVEIWVGQVN